MGTNNKNKLNSAQFRVMRAPLYSALVNLISPDLMRKHEHKLCSCKPQNRRLDNIFADNSHILSCFSFCEIFIFHVFCYEKVVVDIFFCVKYFSISPLSLSSEDLSLSVLESYLCCKLSTRLPLPDWSSLRLCQSGEGDGDWMTKRCSRIIIN